MHAIILKRTNGKKSAAKHRCKKTTEQMLHHKSCNLSSIMPLWIFPPEPFK
jgi:hypothetical protein